MHQGKQQPGLLTTSLYLYLSLSASASQPLQLTANSSKEIQFGQRRTRVVE
jgi:hypothetical protein